MPITITTTTTNDPAVSIKSRIETTSSNSALAPETTTISPTSSALSAGQDANTTPVSAASTLPTSEAMPTVGAASDEFMALEHNKAEQATRQQLQVKLAASQSKRQQQQRLRTSTEPSGPYKSLPTPSQVSDAGDDASQPKLTTLKLKATRMEPTSAQDDMIGSNKVLPEEEDNSAGGRLSASGGASSPASQASSVAVSGEPAAATTMASMAAETATSRPAGTGFGPGKSSPAGSSGGGGGGGKRSYQQQHHHHQRNHIKLFHFKRKPDMNKLPFYKKPLNYTELGWTSEQIQEHLESIGFAPASANSAPAPGSPAKQAADPTGSAQDQSQLLKRKRRGKSQFERLMAELHGANQIVPMPNSGAPDSGAEQGSSSGELANTSTNVNVNVNVNDQDDSDAKDGRQQSDLVPVMRKKSEPLVMKPMFFVMNQKRRNNNNSTGVGSSSAGLVETSGKLEPPQLDGSNGRAHNKSKPIIRMRRKHNGDQPAHKLTRLPIFELLAQQQAAPWRPSKPFWSSSSAAAAFMDREAHYGQLNKPSGDKQLLLVPSGLLTPSGSHLIPLYAPNQANLRPLPVQAGNLLVDEQSRLAGELFAWRAAQPLATWQAAQQQQQLPDPQTISGPMKPSAGMAPNGEESFLVAPTSLSNLRGLASQMEADAGERVRSTTQASGSINSATNQQRPDNGEKRLQPAALQEAPAPPRGHNPRPQPVQASGSGQQLSTSKSEGELRVPKLLKKPMRPAKYSLNGYIPKPSLGQQQVTQQQQQPQQLSTVASAALSTGTGKQKQPRANNNAAASAQNKDLVSITLLVII